MTATTTARTLFATTIRQCRTSTIGSLTTTSRAHVCRSIQIGSVMCLNTTSTKTPRQPSYSMSRRYFSNEEKKNSEPVTTVDFELGNTDPEDDGDENNQGNASKNDKDVIDLSLFTEEVEVRMPDMGEGEGKVVKWYKKEGDIIRWQDTLCDIETPDFTFGMMTEDEGDAVLSKILVQEGSDPVEDGAVLCITLHKEEDGGSKEE